MTKADARRLARIIRGWLDEPELPMAAPDRAVLERVLAELTRPILPTR